MDQEQMEEEAFSVTLKVREWNVIFGALGKEPFVRVSGLLAKMHNELRPKIEARARETEEKPKPKLVDKPKTEGTPSKKGVRGNKGHVK